MERKLKDLLLSNRADSVEALPLVHTAPAYYIQKILTSGKIEPRPCDVFVGQKLAYFFVGRPAYKSVGRDTMHWELPSCVITEFENPKPKRVHPFDTGAFKKNFLPKYVTMIDIEDYEIDGSRPSVEKYIGIFFGTSKSYYFGEPKSKDEFLKRHGILPTEASLHALISLISGERITKELDERRSSIEYQFDETIELSSGAFKAVVIPEAYLKDRQFIRKLENSNISVITYPKYPLNTDHYYFAMYERCLQFYEDNGYV